jgi:hypothetical protein
MKQSNSSLPAKNLAQAGQKSEQNAKNINLEHHFNQVKAENYTETFPDVENWLYKANIAVENKKQTNQNERKLHKMKKFFFANKLRLVYTVVALAVIVAACNMPVTHTETAGQMITLTIPAENTGFASKMSSLPWLKDAHITANEYTDNGTKQVQYTIVLPNTTQDQVKSYSKELESLGGVTMIRIKPVNYDIKRPLYSEALDNFFSIKFDATGMSDEELEKQVQKQLDEQGINMKFKFKTGTDGKRDVFIEKDDNSPGQFELMIDENNGNEKFKIFTKKADPEMFKGKSDQEIRDIVKKDNPELRDEDIKIIRDGDKVQVKVEVDKKEMK